MGENGKIPSLIESGDWVLNVKYLISRHRVGKPDPRLDLDIRMEDGVKVRLKGDDALAFDRKLSRLIVPDDPPGETGPVVSRTRKPRGKASGSAEGD